MNQLNRREFLQHSSILTAGLGMASRGLSADPPKDKTMLPIIDTHQHLWDLKKFRLPWVKPDDKILGKNHVMSDYLDAVKGLNVVKTVYMEVDVAPDLQVAEAEYVIELCKQADNPMVAAVISGRPASEEFPKYVERFKNSAYIKGVRQVLHVDGTKPGYCLQDRFVKSVQLLGEMGKSFDLCMRPAELLDAAKLIDRCPDTRFILDHCGNGKVQEKDRTQWQKDIAETAKRKNVVCKISGIVAGAVPGKWTADDLAPIIKHTMNVFGPDRVMFGGDWPVCTLAASFKQWVDALKSIVADRKEEEQKKLFHDNAASFYGIG